MKEFLKYYLSAETIYNIHSPFIFKLLSIIKDPERQYYAFEKIEKERNNLLKDKSLIERMDYGAGSRTARSLQRTIKSIAHTDLSNRKQCEELFRLVEFTQAKNVLELGTSLGIATAYLASANSLSQIITVEADKAIVNIARRISDNLNLRNIHHNTALFTHFLEKNEEVYDIIYLDGHHTFKHTIEYAETCEKILSPYSCFVVDDIFWSRGMHKAWKSLVNSGKWIASIAFHNYGILIKNPQIKDAYHIAYVPVWAKPWQVGFSI